MSKIPDVPQLNVNNIVNVSTDPLEATLGLRAHDMSVVSFFLGGGGQLIDTWKKECQFIAKVFLRIFLAMPVIDL
jgi:hypothetical protein